MSTLQTLLMAHWAWVLLQLYLLPSMSIRIMYFAVSQLLSSFLIAYVVTFSHNSVDKYPGELLEFLVVEPSRRAERLLPRISADFTAVSVSKWHFRGKFLEKFIYDIYCASMPTQKELFAISFSKKKGKTRHTRPEEQHHMFA